MGVSIIICLLIYPVYEFYTTSIIIRNVRNTGQIVLDTYTIKTGKEIAMSIKNGNDYTKYLKSDIFLNDYMEALGIGSDFKGYKEGELVLELKDIKTSFIFDEYLKTKVTFTLSVPIYFMSAKLMEREVNIKLESRYNLK